MFSTARPVQNLKSGAQVQQQQQHPQQQYSQLAFTEPQHRDAVHQLNGFHQSSYNTTSGLHQPLHQQGSSNIHHLQTIQIPMLSALQVPQPSPPANPPQQPQQQNILGQQGQSIPPPPPQNGQDFTLSSILHFLQIEWRRYERDRNEWEIERAEMRARIALLEGERRSFKKAQEDLMRRFGLLELAIRAERANRLKQPPTTTPSKPNAAHQNAKEKSNSGSSPRSEDSPLPPDRARNGVASTQSRQPSWTTKSTVAGQVSSTLQSAGVSTVGLNVKAPPGRDPKSRARSREYLKQCLQEISYLTSPQAMNPLPNRPLITSPSVTMGPSASNLNAGSTSAVGANVGAAPGAPIPGGSMGMNGAQPLNVTQPQPQGLSPFDAIYNGRPRKQLSDAAGMVPGVGASGPPGREFQAMGGGAGVDGGPGVTSPPPPSLDRGNAHVAAGAESLHQQQQQLFQQSQPQQASLEGQGEQGQQPPQSLATSSSLHRDGTSTELPSEDGQPLGSLTAIFRPEEAGNWQAKLRASYGPAIEQWRDREEEESEEVVEEEDESEAVGVGIEDGDGETTQLWKPKRTLRSHLDTVRAIAFHPTELCLATGGDDCTVKIWRVDVSNSNPASSAMRPMTESEPQLTLRGHSAAITRIVHSPMHRLIYSASFDSSIRVWALPPASHTTYAPYDPTSARDVLIGHTDAVWDLALSRDEGTLISCGAEGAVKVWDVPGLDGRGALRLSWGYRGLGRDDGEGEEDWGAAAVEAIKADLTKVAVAYDNAVVKIFEIETGREVAMLDLNSKEDSPVTRATRIASHPTKPELFVALEDRHIRVFDINTGECKHDIAAHLEGVTSLSIDPAMIWLASGSHDCSVRFWDLSHPQTCTQEIISHRKKAEEGILDVEFHQNLPFMASAGADGVVKLYTLS